VARGNETRRYESMIVFRADLQEAGTKEQIERVRKQLEGQGAEISGLHEWGMRELAYDIGKERRGFYVLVEYLSTSAAVAELERNLKLSDAVLRFVSVRQGKDTPPAAALPIEDGGSDVTADIDDDDDEALGADAEVGDVE
jgi:small subunit ribosomal protein S6